MAYKHTTHDYSDNLKICSKCTQKKKRSFKNFHRASSTKDGLAYICKECKKDIDKQSRKDNKKSIDLYHKTPKFIYARIKYQSAKRGIFFELSYNEYLEIIKGNCFYCGGKTKNWVDRYINNHAIGYTAKNSVACCEACNKMKRDKDPKDFINQCKKISKFNA